MLSKSCWLLRNGQVHVFFIAYQTITNIWPQVFNQELVYFIKLKCINIWCECLKKIINQITMYETEFPRTLVFWENDLKWAFPFGKFRKVFGNCMKYSRSVERKNDLAVNKAWPAGWLKWPKLSKKENTLVCVFKFVIALDIVEDLWLKTSLVNPAVNMLNSVLWSFTTVNGWQLAKIEKECSWHVPAMKFIGMKQLV